MVSGKTVKRIVDQHEKGFSAEEIAKVVYRPVPEVEAVIRERERAKRLNS